MCLSVLSIHIPFLALGKTAYIYVFLDTLYIRKYWEFTPKFHGKAATKSIHPYHGLMNAQSGIQKREWNVYVLEIQAVVLYGLSCWSVQEKCAFRDVFANPFEYSTILRTGLLLFHVIIILTLAVSLSLGLIATLVHVAMAFYPPEKRPCVIHNTVTLCGHQKRLHSSSEYFGWVCFPRGRIVVSFNLLRFVSSGFASFLKPFIFTRRNSRQLSRMLPLRLETRCRCLVWLRKFIAAHLVVDSFPSWALETKTGSSGVHDESGGVGERGGGTKVAHFCVNITTNKVRLKQPFPRTGSRFLELLTILRILVITERNIALMFHGAIFVSPSSFLLVHLSSFSFL